MAKNKKPVQVVDETAATTATAVEASIEGTITGDGATTVEAVKVDPTASVETSTEEAVKDADDEIEKMAQKLMKDNRIQQIWRCPVRGYCFTREDNANDLAKTIGKPLTHFTLK